MLDHLSGGRFEFGTGRGSSSTEFQGFGIPDADTTRDLFDEALPEVVRILREAPYAHDGRRLLDAVAHRAAAAVDRAAPAALARVREPVDLREGRAASAWARCASRWASPRTSRR